MSSIYAVNVSIESMQKGMINKLAIRYNDYDSIRKNILVKQVRTNLKIKSKILSLKLE